MGSKKNKIRVELRKNRAKPPRENDLTRAFQEGSKRSEDACSTERVRAKGDISRYRTVNEPSVGPARTGEKSSKKESDQDGHLRGRVLRAHGLQCVVEIEDGRLIRCTIRQLLKNRATDERNIVTTGDLVWINIHGTGIENPLSSDSTALEGTIERVEPRHGVLTRASRRREHVLVANVDQLVIVMSLVEPELKPHLIDRYLAAARQGGLKTILCLHKIDLADPVELQRLVGAYSQLGVPTLLTSIRTERGIGRLRELLQGRATVFSGQSGVGKTSLLNAVQPGLALKVKSVSEVNQKGRHTTTYAQLIRLDTGGWVVDTPGVRQLQLWDTRPEEVEGYFGEFRAFVPLCAFPDCTHTHEMRCGVKDAVARRLISDRRYHSYLGMFNGSEV